ncbi:ubiquinone oxidoreductase 20 kd subunit [Mycena belliarum]|uniref:Ubiquinone oxidoreductase 20 kd subunit n=1 Tax=Mycena belliarum TaxID=1033014 RepID=A0AAD6UIF2_9AGAR|nr:ubiquinone oxidoreductase 20 kd subunit [Mycena belliae]
MLRRTILTVGRRSPAAAARLSSAAPVPAPSDQAAPATPAVLQAPNAPTTWSTNQQSRPGPASSPRFEQTAMELQPNPLSAMALINDVPPTMVNGRRATCDGGGGPLGHPKIYLNLDLPGPRSCGYCGLRFEQVHHHH